MALQGLLEQKVHHAVGAYSRPMPMSLGPLWLSRDVHKRGDGTEAAAQGRRSTFGVQASWLELSISFFVFRNPNVCIVLGYNPLIAKNKRRDSRAC